MQSHPSQRPAPRDKGCMVRYTRWTGAVVFGTLLKTSPAHTVAYIRTPTGIVAADLPRCITIRFTKRANLGQTGAESTDQGGHIDAAITDGRFARRVAEKALHNFCQAWHDLLPQGYPTPGSDEQGATPRCDDCGAPRPMSRAEDSAEQRGEHGERLAARKIANRPWNSNDVHKTVVNGAIALNYWQRQNGVGLGK